MSTLLKLLVCKLQSYHFSHFACFDDMRVDLQREPAHTEKVKVVWKSWSIYMRDEEDNVRSCDGNGMNILFVVERTDFLC